MLIESYRQKSDNATTTNNARDARSRQRFLADSLGAYSKRPNGADDTPAKKTKTKDKDKANGDVNVDVDDEDASVSDDEERKNGNENEDGMQ